MARTVYGQRRTRTDGLSPGRENLTEFPSEVFDDLLGQFLRH